MGHHYVPQRYLKNFEDQQQTGWIWLHDKHGPLPRLVPISKVVQAKNFYTADTERQLARMEIPANKVIEKLTTSRTITPSERVQLAYYIGVMMMRIPARRRKSKEMIPGALADVVAEFREQLIALANRVEADPELLAARLRELATTERKLALQPPQQVLDQIKEPWPSQNVVASLFGMTWRVLVSHGPHYFMTTDNPAFFFSGYGLAREASEVSFPLSTTHALHASWERARSNLVFGRATQAIVKEFNRRLASEAERLAFYHEPAPWVVTILQKKAPYLSVIRWSD